MLIVLSVAICSILESTSEIGARCPRLQISGPSFLVINGENGVGQHFLNHVCGLLF